MDLSIIIVSWNVKNLLQKCLESIYRETKNISFEIFVIDNASTDGSAEMVRNNFPQVKLIVNKKNEGFAKGNNQGIKESHGDFILILNPDTEILDGAIEKTLDFIKSKKDAGIVGCQILNADKTIQPSVRRFPSFWPIFLIFLKLPKLFSNLSTVSRYLATDFNYQSMAEVEQVMGAFILIKRELFEKVGLFDEKFFIWFEEVDLCKRAQKNGYKVYFAPLGKIIHYGGQSFAQQKVIKKQWLFFRSAWYYFIKNGF
ncbi:MAG: glycosyltransferase family 2 protein [Patescibacteria group bacterium]|nr:glycosyltransferase family 2 protein [Patescibacteria group bacterium]MDD5490487.1 glycosyltransferase family 2 protein [Patescibacteria group bacterium]